MAAVNFRAPFFLTAALAPQMAARGHGAIVDVSTMVAARGAAGMAAYGAGKAALEALTRSSAPEFGPAGVRVNAVALGPSRTEVTNSTGDMLAAASPLGHQNEPDEVARVIAYLAGPDARPVTGTVLAVDAGRVATLWASAFSPPEEDTMISCGSSPISVSWPTNPAGAMPRPCGARPATRPR